MLSIQSHAPASRGNQLFFNRALIHRVVGRQAKIFEHRGHVLFVGIGLGNQRRLASTRVDIELVGKFLNQVIASVILTHVVLHKLLYGFGDILHQFRVRLELRHRAVVDGVEDSLDQTSDK